MTIKDIFKNKTEQKVTIKGWVISNRGNNNIRFITLNDGSTFENIQIVTKTQAEEMDKVRIGAALEVVGDIKLTPEQKQPLELVSEKVTLVKNTDEDYPLQKQGMSLEVLREIPHLRHRTNLFRSVMRVRSTLMQEIHSYFASKNFLNVSAPIITSNDGEGAGEAFVVDDESKDLFFGAKATLGVTGQLHGESYANGFKNIYTFAPTFRAEKSHTQKHAAEFWMVEPEMAFTDLNGIIKVADEMLKVTIKNTLEKLKPEFDFLEKFVDENLRSRLDRFLTKEIQTIDYKDAVEKLKEVKDQFEIKDIEFGTDLATEHEKYISNKLFNGPVAVINYPKAIKAFYMKQNDDNQTVAAFDVLVPGIGELTGGSQRECDVDKITQRINELNIPQEDLQWYIDLRRFGHAESSGFGLGFERLVMYVTGVENIRDVIPYPRTPKNLKM